jgi:hypothetical protein
LTRRSETAVEAGQLSVWNYEISAHERLADAVPLADLVTAPRRRASGKPVAGPDEQEGAGAAEPTRELE